MNLTFNRFLEAKAQLPPRPPQVEIWVEDTLGIKELQRWGIEPEVAA